MISLQKAIAQCDEMKVDGYAVEAFRWKGDYWQVDTIAGIFDFRDQEVTLDLGECEVDGHQLEFKVVRLMVDEDAR